MQPNFNPITSHDTTQTGARLIGLWAVMGWIVLGLPSIIFRINYTNKHIFPLQQRLRTVLMALLFGVLVVTFASPVSGAITKVKDIGTNTLTATGTTISVTVPAGGVAAGNSIIVTFAMPEVSGTVSCSDSAGNSYTADVDKVNNGNVRTVILSAHNVLALSSGNTIIVTHPSTTDRAMYVGEFSGLAASSTLDIADSNSGNATSMTSNTTGSTSEPRELLIGALGVAGPTGDNFTHTSPWNALTEAGTSVVTLNSQYQIVSTTGTYDAAGTNSVKRKYAACYATYKAPPAYLDQVHYRWRNDDGTEATASWGPAEDTKIYGIQKASGIHRLRFLVSNGGDQNPAVSYQLQVNETATCSSAGYSAVPTAATGDWQIIASQLVDGAVTTTITGLTDPVGYTWVDGEQEENSNTTDSITLDKDQFTEIEFYGQPVTALYAKYGRHNVYWLVTAGGIGTPRRMLEIDGIPAAGALAATHTTTVHYEEDEYYHGSAPGDESLDRWFFDDLVLGSALTGTPNPVPVDFSINLPGVSGQGSLTISMWGYYDTYHDLEIQVNGVTANIANWSGISFHEVTLDGINLLEGDNIITLICNRDMDAVIVDWFEITYARVFAAFNNTLKFSHDSGYRYQISDFNASNLVVFDITQATDTARVVNLGISGPNPYTLEFEPPVNPGATETYLVLTSDASMIPVGLIEDKAADLALTANGADYILITHRDLGWDANGDAYGWLDDLVALREGQGLRVKVVDVQDIFDEFSYGMTSASAIRDFLSYAYNNWEPPAPQYILLVGDSSYDFRDNLQLGITSNVPAYLTVTQLMGETLTDEWFVKISGEDAVPDLYIGRLPAESDAEAADMINKIIAYETSPNDKTWQKNTLLIADDQSEAYEADFETMNEDAADLLPASMNAPFKGYLNDYLAASGLKDDIKAQISAGTLIVNYSGHGSFQR